MKLFLLSQVLPIEEKRIKELLTAVSLCSWSLQVESRAHLIWGGEEGLERERDRRQDAKEKRKEKNYVKKLKGW